MNKIELNNIKVYAFHGCMQEEALVGADYIINLSVETDLSKAGLSDNLDDALNYVLLNDIILEQMKIRSNLLEHVCQRILNKIKSEFSNIHHAKLKICKMNPPVNGQMESIGITMGF